MGAKFAAMGALLTARELSLYLHGALSYYFGPGEMPGITLAGGMTVSDLSDEELRENFEYFDKNGNGKLNRIEFGELMAALGAVEPGTEPSRGFSSIDINLVLRAEKKSRVKPWVW